MYIKSIAKSRIILFCLLIIACAAYNQNISFEDLRFSKGYVIDHPDKNRFTFSYELTESKATLSRFRKIEFDTTFRVTDTTVIVIQGDYDLAGVGSMGRSFMHVFGSDIGDLICHFSDPESNRVKITKIASGLWNPKKKLTVQTVPQHALFLISIRMDNKTQEIIALDTTFTIRWKKVMPLQSKKTQLERPRVQGQHAYLFFHHKRGTKKQATAIRRLEIDKGVEVSPIPLDNVAISCAVDNVFQDEDHIYVTGRKFLKGRLSHNEPGLFFVSKIGHDGNISNPKLPSLPPNLKTFWMDLVSDQNGEKYFVGETFTSGSKDSYWGKAIATGILTLGILSVTWNTMRFNDVALFKLSDQDFPKLELFPMPSRSIQLGAYLDPYVFANYSYQMGQVRYFGSDQKGRIIYLNGKRVEKYSVNSKESKFIVNASEYMTRPLHVSNSFAITLNEDKFENRVELQLHKF